MKTGAVVKYGNQNCGIFLYAHEKNSKDDTLCSVFSKKNNRITHICYKDIEVYEDMCMKDEEGIHIYDLENWYSIKGIKLPDGEDNYWTVLENNILVYKGDILDIEFEMCIEEFLQNGIEQILVIDSRKCVVLIYTDCSNLNRANEIINNICDDK